MLDGLDEAVTGLKAGESKTFTSTLVGGQFRGQDAEIEVTVVKVSQQELPEVDDEFAQLISEFDTVEEMKEDLRKGAEQQVKAMWEHCYQTHPVMAKKMRRNVLNVAINLPGSLGRELGYDWMHIQFVRP